MKNKSIILLYTAALFTFTACADYLEEENRNFLSDQILLSNPQALDQLVANGYDRLRLATSNFDLDHQGTDVFTRRDIVAGISDLNDYVNLLPTNGAVGAYWANYYNVIAAVNTAISRVDEIQGLTAADRTRGLAEAKFLRAYSYFHLVENYGEVPLILEEIQTAQTEFSRASEAEVYGQIITDLDEALAGVDETPSLYGRASKDAVRHLKAKVLLTRGYKDFGNETDFTEAAALAETVVANHPLVDDFASLVSRENQRNSEVIFAVLYGADPVARGIGNFRHLLFKFVYDVYPGQTRSTLYHRGLGRAPTPYFYELFEEGDEREAATVRRLMIAEVNSAEGAITAGDTSIYFPKNAWSQEEIQSKEYEVINPGEYYTPNGITQVHFPMFKKFDDPGVPYTNPGINPDGERDAVLMRSGETRLIAAEAYLQAGNTTEAAEHLNALRSRAGLDNPIAPADVTLDLILDESAIEMAGEISRWMDLKRTGKLIERVLEHNPHAALNNAIKAFHYRRPIPQSEVDVSNGSIEQNEGYN
ncbi:RagB/SusD family nutrient uptake outer membrane protein [Cyclobacterium salsum]|uniref:RagB/SusD family nutrient uptake outer membrane protein n=1 Tax=Cyclobacterium salsum TaxID=2666329 RepID=UPI001390D8B5|nr:RagB/SusD family nutrient uptake outer membrane protein [Cyclobacterium salsum]